MSEFGLDDLFTVKEYVTKSVIVVRKNGVRLDLKVLQSPAACTDFDLTGQVIWPVSCLVSHYIATLNLAGKTVLELGAGGTAVPSLTAATIGAESVMATDGSDGPVLELLKQNIALHQCGRYRLQCRQLLWGCRTHVSEIIKECGNVDILVAADVVQWPAVVEPLLDTVKALLWREKRRTTKKTPMFILGIVNRATSTYSLFFERASAMMFDVERILPSTFLPSCEVPSSCREYGGRESELWALTLRFDAAPPELLRSDGVDRTIGKSYENTAFLPC